MHFSWPETFRSGLRRSRRSKRSLGAQQTLESRALLSAIGVGQVPASVDSPRIYGPLQLTTSSSETTAADVAPSVEPVSPPPVVQDYNGLWTSGPTLNYQLQVNSKGTKIKGQLLYSTVLGNYKLKGKIDGLVVTATAKGKTDSPTDGKGKGVVNLTFELTDPTHWSGDFEFYFKKSLEDTGSLTAEKTT